MIKEIQLDLDDVLVDCTFAALNHMGLRSYGKHDYPTDIGRNLEIAYALKTGVKFTPAEWWEHFNRKWWADLEYLPRAKELIDYCAELVGRENVYIVTTPTICGDCLAGKMDWMEYKAPKWLHRQYSITPRKGIGAGPGCVLIDDSNDNIDAFESAVNPGVGILYPQPWNDAREYMDDPVDFVMRTMEFEMGVMDV